MAQRLSDFIAENSSEPKEAPTKMRLGDFMAMNSVQYSDDEEKSLFDQNIISVPNDSDKEYFRSRGPIGAFESFARNARPLTFVPFAGAVEKGTKDFLMLQSVGRLHSNDYSDPVQRNKDAQEVSSYLRDKVEEQTRGYSFGGKVVNVIKDMPAFMMEFMATGGLATGGRMAARKGAEALLERAQTQAMTRIIAKKVSGTVGSIATRTAAIGSARVPENMANRMLDQQVKLSDKGVKILEAGKQKPFTTLIKSVGDVAFEVASEQSGATIRKIAGAAFAPVAKLASPVTSRIANNRMVKSITMLMDKLKAGGLTKELADKAKFDGILEEYGEERWGNFLKAVSGVDDFGQGDNSSVMDRVVASLPSMEDSLVELAAFSVPAAGGALASFSDRVDADNAKGVDEQLITNVANEIIAQQSEAQDAQATGGTALPTSQEKGAVGDEAGGIRLRDNAEAGVEAKAGKVKSPLEMSVSELNDRYAQLKQSEKNADLEVFGSQELVDRYNKAQRMANSSNPDTADKGSKIVEEMESGLTEEQQKKLFGIGQEYVADDIKSLIDAANKVDISSPEAMGQSLKYAVTRVGDKTNIASLTVSEKEALYQLKYANDIAVENGWDTNAILQTALKSSAERFSDPEDALFMLKRFLKPEGGGQVIDIAKTPPSIPGQPSPILQTPEPPEQKVAKAAADINRKYVEQGISELPLAEQATYTPVKKEEKTTAAAMLMSSDYERAKRVAFGQETGAGVDEQVIFNAVKNRAIAEGDADTQARLAKSPVATARSLAAQTLGAAGYDNGMGEVDPIKANVDISETRKKRAEEKIGKDKIAKETKEEKAKIKEATRKAIKKVDWEAFVKSLEC